MKTFITSVPFPMQTFIKSFLIFLLIIISFFAPAFTLAFASANDLSELQERLIQQSISQERFTQQELSKTPEAKAIWRVNITTRKGLAKKQRLAKKATAFFISSNLIVTNLHVVIRVTDFSEITLTQDGNTKIIHIEGFHSLSALHDLAILKIKGRVPHYLKIKEKSPGSKEDLHNIGYPDGDLKRINKTSRLFHEGSSFYFFTDYFNPLSGASGSPLLDKEGSVAGVLSGASSDSNIVFAEKLNTLKRLIKSKPLSLSDAKKSIDEEIKNLKRLASQEGDARVQYRLAAIYEDQEKIKEAFFWLKKASDRGYSSAQASLASFYVEENFDEAIKLYKASAEQGNPLSQVNLGFLYNSLKDIKEAIKWFKKVAERGHPDASFNLGVIYQDKGDIEEAIYWYEEAAKRGYPDAQFILGILYKDNDALTLKARPLPHEAPQKCKQVFKEVS